MRVFLLIYIIISTSCTQKTLNKPTYISFEFKNDSVTVFAENKIHCPTHLSYTDLKTNKKKTLDFKALKKKKLFSTIKDTLEVIKKSNFKMLYGKSTPLKYYDTLYNYNLPFLKGKRYRILQGQNTNFTHKGSISKYAIDLKMNTGQIICAMRNGVVVAIKEDSNKGGKSKRYYKDGNYIMIYHKDGLFTQYVHLKKNGAIVKKGDSVHKGQPIGYSGNTGMSTEPHLHFGVFKPTINGFTSIPYILDSIPTKKYKKGKYTTNN